MFFPYPGWLNAGDNAWQLTAATFVALMSVPGLQSSTEGWQRKVGREHNADDVFRLRCRSRRLGVLGLRHGFRPAVPPGGYQRHRNILDGFLGHPGSITGPGQETNQAIIPSLAAASPPFHFPYATLAYFQFVFAAITPLLFWAVCSAA